MSFRNWLTTKMFTEANDADFLVSGSGIDTLKQVFHDMGSRGAPNERNDWGFNKTGFDAYRTIISSSEFKQLAIPISLVKKILNILSVYKNTQLKSFEVHTSETEEKRKEYTDFYQHLVDLVQQDIETAQKKLGKTIAEKPQENTVVVYNNEPPHQFGNIKVFIPNVDRSFKIKINATLDNYFQSKGFSKEKNQYGSVDYSKERWKHFQNDKHNPNLNFYLIKPTVINLLAELFKKQGLEVKFLAGTVEDKPETKPKITVVREEQTPYGKKIVLTFWLEFNDSNKLRNELERAGLWRKIIGFMGKDPKTNNPLYGLTPNSPEQNQLINIFKPYLDTSELETYLGKPVITDSKLPKLTVLGKEQTHWGEKLLVTYDLDYNISNRLREELNQKGLWKNVIGFLRKDNNKAIYGISTEDKTGFDNVVEVLKQYLDVSDLEKLAHTIKTEVIKKKMTFVDREGGKLDIHVENWFKHNEKEREFIKQLIKYTFPGATYNMSTRNWEVNGDYNQYVIFGKLLKRYGWDVDELRDIVVNKLESKKIERQPIEGKVPDNFTETINQRLPNSIFELYPLQKEGVGFLYSRKSAILGDETGLGKTVQLIAAAEIKMQESAGDTLIITLKSIVDQWKKEILGVIGTDKEQLISTDVLSPKRWTIIYYDMFSKGKSIQNFVDSVKQHDFLVVIFDEMHKIKHASAAKSINIETATQQIPYRWGASATISSNLPINVRNQLVMIGHHLGKLSEGLFKREFAGMVPEGWGGAYTASKDREIEIKAAENLNKWLNLTGVYVRKKKEDIREMPALTVQDKKVEINQVAYNQDLRWRISQLKDPNLIISVLGATRQALAFNKVPKTVEESKELVANNKRLVVFTNFIESGGLLKEKLGEVTKVINPNWKILTYTSDTPAKELKLVKNKFIHEQDYRILLMSMKMGGTGIDFPNAAQNMLINDFDWTPEQAEQSIGRIFRINTNHPVDIKYIIAHGTLDEKLFDILKRKMEIANIIQQYRKDYQEDVNPEQALQNLINAQLEMDKVDADMGDVVRQAAREANPNVRESFKEFYNDNEGLDALVRY